MFVTANEALAISPKELPEHNVVSVGGFIDPPEDNPTVKIVCVTVSEHPAAFVTTRVTVD